jgi:class 3 adenylate cyclase/ABC-type oligopeptide transport system substrate-binding subunit/sugar lactone lactonase YvrE
VVGVDRDGNGAGTELRTFLIADIRGYTTYTREHGDEAAGALAARFAEIVREVAEANEGFLLELRGDEALVVFVSARNALRAAVAIQARLRERELPRGVGIGLDAGEAVAIEGGYRGGALNLAARLCARAIAGEVLASEAVIHLAAKVDGLAYVDARTLKLKGYDRPVRAVDVVSSDRVPGGISHRVHRLSSRLRADRRIQTAIGLIACVAIVAVVLPRAFRDDLAAEAAAGPGLAFLDAASGDLTAHVDVSQPGAAFFAEGRFWVRDADSSAFLAIDGVTHDIVARIPVTIQSGYGAVDGDHLWVADLNSPTLVEVDIPTERTLHEFDLAQDAQDTDGASGIMVADGSVWVQQGDELLRLDPHNGKVRARIGGVSWAGGLAQAKDGTIWAAAWPGLVQVDPQTKERGLELDLAIATGGNVVEQAGALWTTDESKGVVYKVDPDNAKLLDTYETGEGAHYLSAADGQVWVANQDVGTVTRIDALTGELRTFSMDHPLVAVVAGADQAMVTVLPGKTFEDEVAALTGDVARVLVPAYAYYQLDPAIAPYAGNALMQQLANATCARLLRYPSDPAAAGWGLEPEVAMSLPAESNGGRTYAFTIGQGFAFSPPSNEPITAQTYAYSIERALSPVFGDQAQGSGFIEDIEGEAAYRSGDAEHITGIRAEGDTLSITLIGPSDTFLDRLAVPSFCPVPLGTPIVKGGVGDLTVAGSYQPNLASSGPYFISYHLNGELMILQRNPNYTGPHAGTLDAIAIREGIVASEAIGRVEDGTWDLSLVDDPSMSPGGELDARWGPASEAAAAGDQRFVAVPVPTAATIALNAGRPLFADERVRRAVALAVARDELASASGWLAPSDALIPPILSGAVERPLFDPSADLDAADNAMDGAPDGVAVMAIERDCPECEQMVALLRDQLSPLGIVVQGRSFDDPYGDLYSGHAQFDMIPINTGGDTADGASFLSTMLGDYIPRDWLPVGVAEQVERLLRLRGAGRDRATSALAEELTRDVVPAFAYGNEVTTEFFSHRLGCRVFPPFGFGVDLASLCFVGPSPSGG